MSDYIIIYHGAGYISSLPLVIESAKNGVGSSMCLAHEIKFALLLFLPAWCFTVKLNC